MRRSAMLLVAGALALAGCGEDEDSAAPKPSQQPRDDTGAKKGDAGKGTTVTVRGSEFGPMLFGSNRRAIYIFERDSRDRTACYGECAEAWPPVVTRGKPRAAKGVKSSVLGTIERRGGESQVTYAGQPLYYYAHERPGEVRCHNVNLNGGFWWVVGPDGKRRP
jgi:predicted lipoprotein with Yx(FWY)xxD motif